jgi:hypothetical protein
MPKHLLTLIAALLFAGAAGITTPALAQSTSGTDSASTDDGTVIVNQSDDQSDDQDSLDDDSGDDHGSGGDHDGGDHDGGGHDD